MPNIIFVEHDGTEHSVDVEVGVNLMEAATLNMVPGIDGICGGMCACATCHCYLDEQQMYGIDVAVDTELTMLEEALECQENSRLGCQVHVTEKMEGMKVSMPSAQNI